MSKLHFVLVSLYGLVVFGGPVMLAVFLEPAAITMWIVSIILTAIVAGACADYQCYPFPLTYRLRALNRWRRAREDAMTLRQKARECRDLAETYRERGIPWQAETLLVQADHNERLAAIKDENAERINRELEDRKMQELTR